MIQTPYYLIDKPRLLRNLQIMQQVRERSGAKTLLALKCFATWGVFDLMRQYMDGTTSSSLNEVRLGKEKFGGETHAYSVAYADHEIDAVVSHADKIIFNSLGQLERFAARAGDLPMGLRLNPGVSSSSFDLADPARKHSRLGEWDADKVSAALDRLPGITGFMIHNNCENESFELFDKMLRQIEERFGALLQRASWVSLGGGIHFVADQYPLDAFCARLKGFAEKYDVQVYLEPGEAAITQTTTLEVTVLDTLYNGRDLAIVDSSSEAHMLDLLIYRQTAKVEPACDNAGSARQYMVCGKSCLAGDIFGEVSTTRPLQVGDRLSIQNAAGYTMVKKNWFNGVAMPAIVVKELDGTLRVQRVFGYDDFANALS
jgi:carboxynorspermidine decarboxylase